MKKIKVIGVVLHNGTQTVSGSELSADNVRVALPTGLPVHMNGEMIGRADVKVKDQEVVASLEFKDEVTENVLDFYAAISGRVQEVEDNVIRLFQLDSVSITANPADENCKPLSEWKAIHEGKLFIQKVINEKKKKGWNDRRIKRYLFTKYKILVE